MTINNEKIPMEKPVKNIKKQTLSLINNYFSLIKNLRSLIWLETQLAFDSLLSIALCFLGLMILSGTIWLSLCSATAFLLLKMGFNFIDCCFLIILFNLLIIGIILTAVKQLKTNLQFSATRQVLTEKNTETV